MSGSPGSPLTIPVNQFLSCHVVMETTKREISNAHRKRLADTDICKNHRQLVDGFGIVFLMKRGWSGV